MTLRRLDYRRIALSGCGTAASFAIAAAVLPAPVAQGASDEFTKQTLHFATMVGPDDNIACDVVGDLYTPSDASAANPVPAILTTNGWGGSKNSQESTGTYYAAHGYTVLAYSGLGFGGSGCRTRLDDPQYDGKAASQLVDFLGGRDGIAFTDQAHTQPVAGLNYVVHDAVDHAGQADRYDPRVGMVGGSYGGGIQFAAASIDPRIDALVPMATWNDLSYSLAPNSTGQLEGVSSAISGAAKSTFGLGLFTDGAILSPRSDGAYLQDPARLLGCPNSADVACQALGAVLSPTGFMPPDLIDRLRTTSVSSYLDRIKVPVLLIQGQQDALFDLNEAKATYDGLRQRGVPASMIWMSMGHTTTKQEPGSNFKAVDPVANYWDARTSAWFDHYLRDQPVDPGPGFAYYRPWVPFTGDPAGPYATASEPRVAESTTLYLSGDETLTSDAAAIRPGTAAFDTIPLGIPAGNDLEAVRKAPGADLPGTFASWTTEPATTPLDVAGMPRLTLRLATERPLNGTVEDSLVLFAKMLDVAPDGQQAVINGLVSPVRVLDANQPVTITMEGLVHRFEPGHRLRVTVSGGESAFRGGTAQHRTAIAAGTDQTLELPVLQGN
ncbi:alpha/beta fold hydrolase [Nocardia sp. NPDC020380]|uniref:alpha/beta fold hydrolase n=1 Tax=Nocardia sp. NPDC020380 TaxID=3364309 RepID=UPI0037B3B6F6